MRASRNWLRYVRRSETIDSFGVRRRILKVMRLLLCLSPFQPPRQEPVLIEMLPALTGPGPANAEPTLAICYRCARNRVDGANGINMVLQAQVDSTDKK